MTQLSLFESGAVAFAPPPPDPAFVRKHLIRLLKIARAAEKMPWSASEAESWTARFPKLAEVLPADEARDMTEAFRAELTRLRSTQG